MTPTRPTRLNAPAHPCEIPTYIQALHRSIARGRCTRCLPPRVSRRPEMRLGSLLSDASSLCHDLSGCADGIAPSLSQAGPSSPMLPAEEVFVPIMACARAGHGQPLSRRRTWQGRRPWTVRGARCRAIVRRNPQPCTGAHAALKEADADASHVLAADSTPIAGGGANPTMCVCVCGVPHFGPTKHWCCQPRTY